MVVNHMEKQDVNIHENIYSARILYCPECGAANLLGSVSEQEIELSREKEGVGGYTT